MASRVRTRKLPGFTLVELMVVIGIIGMLLAIAVPKFIRAREGSQARACQHNLMQILGAKERWAMDGNHGPTDTPQMSDLCLPVGYLRQVPVCPTGGTYTVGRLDQIPTCSIGGTPGAFNAHVLP